jgi:5-methylcytosine-specific restriction endonuclease McrA
MILTKPKKKKSRRKRLEKQLDDLWREAVYRNADMRCEYCGDFHAVLNSHHIFSRSNRAVRWDEDNGICLCVSHHLLGNLSFHKAPAEMMEWLQNHRPHEWYIALRRKAGGSGKFSLQELEDMISHYKDKLKELE